jgi:hypothetical protein
MFRAARSRTRRGRPHRPCSSALILGVALSLSLGAAHAQSPEKFEQVAPRAQPAAPKPQPRAAPAKPPEPAPTPAAPALVPLDQQPPVVELKRKAKAKEAENGFCLGVSWPHPSQTTKLDAIVAGTLDHYRSDTSCGLTQAMSVVTEEGRRCVNMIIWRCRIAAACSYLSAKFCKQDDGRYYEKKSE